MTPELRSRFKPRFRPADPGGVWTLAFVSLLLVLGATAIVVVLLLRRRFGQDELQRGFESASHFPAPQIVGLIDRLNPGAGEHAGAEGMIGERAVVVATSDAGIRVRIHGETWRATCDRPLAVGSEARVVSIHDLTLHVEPL